MLRKTSDKRKSSFIRVDDFLDYTPKRGDYKWAVDEKGIVHITVPKFTSRYGFLLCRMLKRDVNFIADLDRIGSLVWLNCDGENTVRDILDILRRECGDEKDLDQRLFLFLQQMRTLNYIIY
ncbi:MAG: PqqD family protein [Candidatus Thermoplasmatota archaeon]